MRQPDAGGAAEMTITHEPASDPWLKQMASSPRSTPYITHRAHLINPMYFILIHYVNLQAYTRYKYFITHYHAYTTHLHYYFNITEHFFLCYVAFINFYQHEHYLYEPVLVFAVNVDRY